jgi:hypothetical protein
MLLVCGVVSAGGSGSPRSLSNAKWPAVGTWARACAYCSSLPGVHMALTLGSWLLAHIQSQHTALFLKGAILPLSVENFLSHLSMKCGCSCLGFVSRLCWNLSQLITWYPGPSTDLAQGMHVRH